MLVCTAADLVAKGSRVSLSWVGATSCDYSPNGGLPLFDVIARANIASWGQEPRGGGSVRSAARRVVGGTSVRILRLCGAKPLSLCHLLIYIYIARESLILRELEISCYFNTGPLVVDS